VKDDARHRAPPRLRLRLRPETGRLRQKQACHVIERKDQLAHHEDKRNREKIEAIVHRRVTISEEGLRGSNPIRATMIRHDESEANLRQRDFGFSSPS
jgi:hypothetical protein